MKKIIIYLILIISVKSHSQNNEVLAYIPLKTYHFNRTPEVDEYIKGEGGNVGLVAIYRRYRENKFNDIQAGVIRNSYGNLAMLAQYGFGCNFDKLSASINIGVISGYKNIFQKNKIWYTTEVHEAPNIESYTYQHKHIAPNDFSKLIDILPKFMSNNGVIPSVVLSFTYDTNNIFKPTVNFSPEFINVGVTLRI